MRGAGKFDGKRGDPPVWLRLLRGVPLASLGGFRVVVEVTNV